MENIKVGDLVGWKRNGSYGSYEAKVVSIGKRIRIHILTWCGQKVKDNWFVNVTEKRIRTTKPQPNAIK